MKSEIGTFAKVFPDTTLWNPDLLEEGYDLVALGRAEETPISESAIQARLDAAPRVKKSLEEVMLKSAADILYWYAERGRILRHGSPTRRSIVSGICGCSIWRDWPRTWTSGS